MITLGIESSCDETAAAVLDESGQVLSDVVASQDVHAKYGGVVPELASRQHIVAIDSVIEQALAEAEVSRSQIDLVAATYAPGLVGGLLVGLQAGKALAFSLGKPFVGVHHLEGHLMAVNLDQKEPLAFPHIALVVSGGHSELVLVRGFADYEVLGRTRDDAAGEAFDKVAKLLGLGYPGGRPIDERARQGMPGAESFTSLMVGKKTGLDFSFSGIKTAVRNRVYELDKMDNQTVDNICAAFQSTVVEVLVRKTKQAVKMTGVKHVQLCGGVAANSQLREEMKMAGTSEGFDVHIAAPKWCTDNAAMIALAGQMRFRHGMRHGFDLSPKANLPLQEIGL